MTQQCCSTSRANNGGRRQTQQLQTPTGPIVPVDQAARTGPKPILASRLRWSAHASNISCRCCWVRDASPLQTLKLPAGVPGGAGHLSSQTPNHNQQIRDERGPTFSSRQTHMCVCVRCTPNQPFQLQVHHSNFSQPALTPLCTWRLRLGGAVDAPSPEVPASSPPPLASSWC